MKMFACRNAERLTSIKVNCSISAHALYPGGLPACASGVPDYEAIEDCDDD